jgi:hypothetical protein
MSHRIRARESLELRSCHFYRRILRTLNQGPTRFLLGGAYALTCYTGIERHTKDLDVFVRRKDCQRVLRVLADAGFTTELSFPHWLAKAFCRDNFIDIIFSSGNGIAKVDDEWFENAVPARILGIPVRLCPIEEMIWSKAFVMERERFDGADIAHLLRARGCGLDWGRLLRRFDQHWPVLLSHLILFAYIYPGAWSQIPDEVMACLLERARDANMNGQVLKNVCRGTLLNRAQYLVDIRCWGYQDPRLLPGSSMSKQDVDHWTAAINSPSADKP